MSSSPDLTPPSGSADNPLPGPPPGLTNGGPAPGALPQQIPTHWEITAAQKADGQKVVAIRITSATGIATYFLQPQDAIGVAGLLLNAGEAAAASSLTIARDMPPGLIPGR